MTLGTAGLVSIQSVLDAAATLRGFVLRTPCLPSPELSERVGVPVHLKCENLQVGGAFKARGAYTFLSRRSQAERSRGVVTYSSGNHGRAVALAARALGSRATVVVPVDIPPVKVKALVALDAEVVTEGTTSLERQRRAEALARASGSLIIPPFDDPDIIAGQGTVGLEIVEDVPDVAAVVAPVGGGGLISGVALAVKARRPRARVVGVEPVGAASMRASLDAGAPVTLSRVETVADGLKPVRPGDLTFAHVRQSVDDVVTVSDDEILDAVVFGFRACKLVLEPSGAAGVAALLARRLSLSRGPVVVVLSGGNVEPSLYGEWLRREGQAG
ncbi:MAG: pyridoxal-phosphate dependent enzyme [Gemmatimonadetes bacterium]|nr:pyridoxal-phosphate dependent enzyme [Gemmatimonadota bacterium]